MARKAKSEKPRKVRSFREKVENKAIGPYTGTWLCRDCGNWNRRTVTETPQIIECQCGRLFRATTTNTTIRIEAE